MHGSAHTTTTSGDSGLDNEKGAKDPFLEVRWQPVIQTPGIRGDGVEREKREERVWHVCFTMI
jgi:hypothetical protein